MNYIDELISIINYYDNDELWYEIQIDKAVEVMDGYSVSDWEAFYNEIPSEDETINIRLLECMFALDEKFPARHVAKIATNASKEVLCICLIKLNDHFVPKMDRTNLIAILDKAKSTFEDTEINWADIYAARIKSIEKYCLD